MNNIIKELKNQASLEKKDKIQIFKQLIKFIETNEVNTKEYVRLLKLLKINYMRRSDLILQEIDKRSGNEDIEEKIETNEYQYYPDIDDDEFYKKLFMKKEFFQNQYPEIIEEKGKDVQKDLCPSDDKRYKLLSHQVFLKNYLSMRTPYNSVLVYHGTGVGKSCTAISIAETYKRIIAADYKKIFVLVSGDTIESNFKKEIHDIHRGYDQCTFSEYQNYKLHTSDVEKKKKTESLINKYYEIEHYLRFSFIVGNKYTSLPKKEFIEWVDRIYSNRVIIVDEAHNLKSKDIKEDVEIKLKRYEAMKIILKYSNNVKLILLSATPMNHSSIEIVDILNLLLVNDNFAEIKVSDIFDKKQKITDEGKKRLEHLFKGYVSYVRPENPYTFAKRLYPNSISAQGYIKKKFNLKDEIFGKHLKSTEINLMLCEMGEDQKREYLNYLDGSKRDTQTLIQYGLIGHEEMTSLDSSGIKRKTSVKNIPFENFKGDKLKSMSSKYFKLLENLTNDDAPKGPVFIFSRYYETGILAIACMLIANGFKLSKITSNKYKTNTLFGTLSKFKYKRKIKEKQEKNTNDKGTFTFLSGADDEKTRNDIIELFKDPSNKDGSKLRILIGTDVLKEGVSFYRIRQIHILEPWYNRPKLEQIIGRGLRHCSHKDLPVEDRNVSIYHYASTLSQKIDLNENKKYINDRLKIITESIQDSEVKINIDLAKRGNTNKEPIISYDILMYLRAEILDRQVKVVQQILKRVAIDCGLNRKLNIDTIDKKKNDPYTCISGLDYDKIDEKEINKDTYDSIFLYPYIQYVISIIKKHFEKYYVLGYKELINNELLMDKIYKENNYFIIRKALFLMIPTENTNFNSFIHSFRGKNKRVGYIFGRFDKKQNMNYYIFQEFDNKNIREISKLEQKPIYNRIRKIDDEEQNILTLKVIISTQHYNSWINNKGNNNLNVSGVFSKKRKERKDHGSGNNIIKQYDPYVCHKNDAKIVGIMIDHDMYKDALWIREKDENIKLNVGEGIVKQFNSGKECQSYLRKELREYCNNIFKYITDDIWKILDIYKLSFIIINELKSVKCIIKQLESLIKDYENKNLTLLKVKKLYQKMKDTLNTNKKPELCSILITSLKILQLSEDTRYTNDSSYIKQNWFKMIEQDVDGRGFLKTC